MSHATLLAGSIWHSMLVVCVGGCRMGRNAFTGIGSPFVHSSLTQNRVRSCPSGHSSSSSSTCITNMCAMHLPLCREMTSGELLPLVKAKLPSFGSWCRERKQQVSLGDVARGLIARRLATAGVHLEASPHACLLHSFTPRCGLAALVIFPSSLHWYQGEVVRPEPVPQSMHQGLSLPRKHVPLGSRGPCQLGWTPEGPQCHRLVGYRPRR